MNKVLKTSIISFLLIILGCVNVYGIVNGATGDMQYFLNRYEAHCEKCGALVEHIDEYWCERHSCDCNLEPHLVLCDKYGDFYLQCRNFYYRCVEIIGDKTGFYFNISFSVNPYPTVKKSAYYSFILSIFILYIICFIFVTIKILNNIKIKNIKIEKIEKISSFILFILIFIFLISFIYSILFAL